MLRRTLLVLAVSAFLTIPSLRAASKDEAGVMAAEKGWSTGVAKNDFALLEKFLAADLTYTHSSGASDTKVSYIDKLKTGKARYFVAEYVEEPRIQVLDKQTALSFGRIKVVTLAANGGQTPPATLIFLHAFRKVGDHWQLVAHQSAKLP